MINNSKYIQTIGKNADPNDNSGLPAWAVERVRQCYEVCAEKNVLPPTLPNLDNLPATISEIRASAGVQSPFVINQGTLQTVSEWSIAPATDVGDMVCYHLFYGFESYPITSLTSADLSSLTQITGYDACSGMFQRCVNLTNAPLTNVKLISNSSAAYGMFQYCPVTTTGLDNLEEINGNSACDHMYYKCPNLVSTGLHSLTKISGSQACNEMFEDNTALVDIGLENLVEVNNQMGMREMFIGCSSIEVARFTKLQSLNQTRILEMTFKNCTALREIYFPSLTTIYSNATFGSVGDGMLTGCTDVTVHFLASLQGVIGNWTHVLNGFGGTNTTVLFDLGIETEIVVPANTTLYMNGVLVADGTQQETTTYTRTLSPGENTYFATDGYHYLLTSVEISSENPTINVNFEEYTYGYATILTNAENATYNKYIILPWSDLNIWYIGEGVANIGSNCAVEIHADGYMPRATGYYVEETEFSVYLELFPILQTETYDATNFAQLIDLSDYWAMDGNLLTIHPTISTTYADSRGITFLQNQDAPHGIQVTVTAYVSSESGYDFGFVSLGTEQVHPSASNIKNNVISNGEYAFRQSGQNNSMSETTYDIIDSNLFLSGNKVITIGWGQDSSTSKGTNTLYVQSITVKIY